MTYKNPLSTVRNLLYLMKVLNEAVKLNPPETLSEAKLLLSNIGVIADNAVSETSEDWPALAAA
jgi:hypothetical protein